MDLDQLTIEIRPRRPWEAVDLGVRMAKRWWVPLSLIFLIMSFPFWLLISFLPKLDLYWKFFIFWLLLPLYERPLLLFLSRAVFNELLSAKAILKQSSSIIFKQLLSTLTFRRFSPTRSMDVPVVLLEGLSGKKRASRLSVLHRADSAPATWISFIGVFCVFAIATAIFLIIIQFMSQIAETPWWKVMDGGGWNSFYDQLAGYIYYSLMYLAVVLVTPFYVSAGFALYLNRRIQLEAWDVEIAFKRMVAKRQGASQSLAIVVVLVSLFTTLEVPRAYSEDTATDMSEVPAINPELEQSRSEIKEILLGEDFNRIKIKKTRHLPFEDNSDKKRDKAFASALDSILKKLDNFIAYSGEIILWVLVLCLIFYLVFRYRAWFASLIPESKVENKIAPETLFGLSITKESLPDNVGQTALSLWQEQKYREALALLYRASLSRLVDRGMELQDGDTELQCLHATRQYAKQLKLSESTLRYFGELTRHWRRLAYGHIVMDTGEAESLCVVWAEHWHGQSDSLKENTLIERGNK